MALSFPTLEELGTLTSDERAEIAAAYLASLDPGRQPPALFKEFCRLTALGTFELTPLRVQSGQPPEVLLTQRPDSCPWWPRQWHLPGVVVLPTDAGPGFGRHSYAKTLTRLYAGELATAITIGATHLFDAGLRVGDRGTEQTVYHWAEITLDPDCDGQPPVGRFFDATTVADSPPEGGLIVTHDTSIRRAVAHHAVYSSLPPEMQAAFN